MAKKAKTFTVTQEWIDECRKRYGSLDDQRKRVAVLLAHQAVQPTRNKLGTVFDMVVAKEVKSWTWYYRSRESIARDMGCPASDLPLAVLAAIGALKPYSV